MNDRSIGTLLKDMIGEDVGLGDLTSSFTPNPKVRAVIRSKDSGYVSGIDELQALFKQYNVKSNPMVSDGDRVSKDMVVFRLYGNAHDILLIERTALNILSRMSGITTLTRKYVDALNSVKSRARVTATRKTTPLIRCLEKKAVVVGGGLTHRMGLYDMVLIKDNHLILFDNDVERALSAASNARLKAKVEVEVSNRADALKAAESGADVIMLDNMRPREIRKILSDLEVRGLRRKVLIEVSGGIRLRNIRNYGRLDVDWISIGRLTHSAVALDFSMDFTG
ncbi:MAG: carboxylating nicotinate-nucleotide diphosphorylase [Candidatus Altiarchaeota archaeon]